MDSTTTDNNIIDFEWYDEEDGSVLMAEESPWRGFAVELQDLHYLKGASFINQLKLIINSGEFFPVEGESGIFSAISDQSDDYDNLIKAARKAVEHGYRVYLLPNPRSCRTADFIFVKKGSYTMYDLKTVSGKGSVGTQLLDSIGQSNRILLNINSDYNARLLAADIKSYFEFNRNAIEVLLFKGKKTISVSRYDTQSPMFHRQFRKKYEH
jgi:phosphoheptose isomerase